MKNNLNIAFISLGSNLGNKENNLKTAINKIGEFAEVLKVSSFIETEFWKPKDNLKFKIFNLKTIFNLIISKLSESINKLFLIFKSGFINYQQSSYLNTVIKIQTEFNPQELLAKFQEIENEMGRTRPYKWAPRIIDLDIIAFNKEIINAENLQIPHPLAKQRDFVLIPLGEVDEEMVKWIKNN